MRRRCREKNNAAYKDYGAKGIDVIQRWYDSLQEFVNDVGHPPSGDYSLDRIDNSRGYEPDNVRWATAKEQARNRNVCVKVEFQGQHFSSISHFVEWLTPQVNVNRRTLLREVQKCI
jgi:hypothetical protein